MTRWTNERAMTPSVSDAADPGPSGEIDNSGEESVFSGQLLGLDFFLKFLEAHGITNFIDLLIGQCKALKAAVGFALTESHAKRAEILLTDFAIYTCMDMYTRFTCICICMAVHTCFWTSKVPNIIDLLP